jgi:hypothetical protein
MYTEKLTERVALGAGIPPQVLNNARLNSDGVDMSLSRRAFFILSFGAVTGGGSINAILQEDSVSNFANTVNDTAGSFSGGGGNGVSLTGLTTANKEYTFEVRASQLSAGKRYVRLQIKETGSQNVNVACVCYGDEGIHKPNNANNASAVSTQNYVN